MSWSSLSVNVFFFLQKDLFKRTWCLAKSYFKQNCCHGCHTRFAVFFPLPSCCVSSLLGSVSNKDGDRYENVTQKVGSRCFNLNRAYSVSFISSNVGGFFGSWILENCIKVRQFHVVVVQLRQRNVQKSMMHVKSCWFANFLPFSLPSPSLLLKLPIAGQQLTASLDVICSVCLHTLLRVVGSCCCAKFETGQTFEPTTPNIYLFRDRRSVTQQWFAQLFQHCWGHERALHMVSKVL